MNNYLTILLTLLNLMAIIYCYRSMRKIKKFHVLRDNIGSAIATLSWQVDELSTALTAMRIAIQDRENPPNKSSPRPDIIPLENVVDLGTSPRKKTVIRRKSRASDRTKNTQVEV